MPVNRVTMYYTEIPSCGTRVYNLRPYVVFYKVMGQVWQSCINKKSSTRLVEREQNTCLETAYASCMKAEQKQRRWPQFLKTNIRRRQKRKVCATRIYGHSATWIYHRFDPWIHAKAFHQLHPIQTFSRLLHLTKQFNQVCILCTSVMLATSANHYLLKASLLIMSKTRPGVPTITWGVLLSIIWISVRTLVPPIHAWHCTFS